MRRRGNSQRARFMRNSAPCLLFVVLCTASANAATYTVNTLVDENDGIGTGGVSLREAIDAANANAGTDAITFSVTGTITLTADLPNITESLSIDGPGASSLILDGGHTYRAFKVMSGATLTLAHIAINNMQARGGNGRSTSSGGAGGGAAGMGAALFLNAGSANVSAVTFDGNAVFGGNGGFNDGGSIYYAGGGGGGLGTAAFSEIDGTGGGFLGGAGGGWGIPGNPGGEGAGGGGGGSHAGPTTSAGGAGGFGGGGGGGSAGDFMGVGGQGNGGTGGFGGGGGGAGHPLSGAPAAGGAGGAFAGTGGAGVTNTSQGAGGGGAALGGAIFVRAGMLIIQNCTLSNNSATGGAAGAAGATAGQGKGGAIFVNSGATAVYANLTFSGNAAADDAGTGSDNDNTYGTLGAIPAVSSIARASANPTNAATVGFTVTFNTSVTGVDTGDFVITSSGITGASVASISGSGASYTVTVNTGTGSGTLRLDLVDDDSIMGNAVALGGPGSGNADYSSGESYTIDRTAPTITLSSSAANPTNAAMSVVATLSESSTNFTAGDVTATGGAVSNFNGSGANYSFTLTPTTQGAVSAVVNAGAFTDAAGNGNALSNTLQRTFDSAAPAVVSIVPASTTLATETSTTITVTFNEAVSGFDAADITVNHTGTTSATPQVAAIDAATYVITISSIAGDGSFTITIGAGSVADSAGNTNAAPVTSVAIARQTPPTADDSQPTPDPTPAPASTNDNTTTPATPNNSASPEPDSLTNGSVGDEPVVASETTDATPLDATAQCGAGACGPAGLTQLLTLASLMAIQRRRIARRT